MDNRENINNISLQGLTVEKAIIINKKIKVLLDEESEHFVKDLGALESSIIGVLETPYYVNNLDKLAEM
jgi:hypothetical protein